MADHVKKVCQSAYYQIFNLFVSEFSLKYYYLHGNHLMVLPHPTLMNSLFPTISQPDT